MAATPAPEQADSPAAVLAAAQAEQATAYRAEVRILELALDWAVMHEPDPTDDLGFESAVLIAGEGTPEVGEFCAHELAVALHISTDSGSSLIAEALELAYRLPRVWARVKAGDLPPWRARRIADRTICLPPEGADYVDRHVAPFAHRMGIGQVDRLGEEALVRFDPEKAEARRLAAADNRHVTLYTDQTDFDGTAHLDADLDLADALDLTPHCQSVLRGWQTWAVRTRSTCGARTRSVNLPAAPTRHCRCRVARSCSTCMSAITPSPQATTLTWRGWRTPGASSPSTRCAPGVAHLARPSPCVPCWI